jgi:hypothetical protein
MPHVRTSKRFCSAACRQASYRRRQDLQARGLVDTPVCHLGRFQDYQALYAGKIDVLITDPPYGRESLSLYADLAAFARAVLVPGGWLLCLTGWGIHCDAMQRFGAAGLEFLTVCCYHMPSTRSKAVKWTSTGKRSWQEHHKPLLWYQQPGTRVHLRRAGGNDTIAARVSGSTEPQLEQDAYPWEQDLEAFQEIVRLFTNTADVILDPMAGWGTTLEACVALDRQRCIGIELRPERYTCLRERLAQCAATGQPQPRGPASSADAPRQVALGF